MTFWVKDSELKHYSASLSPRDSSSKISVPGSVLDVSTSLVFIMV